MAAGTAYLPSDVSIAHRLIVDWLGPDVPITTWFDRR